MTRSARSPDLAATLSRAAQRRRVLVATVVGTTVEWYDFFIYAAAAGLLFDRLFFVPAGHSAAVLLSFGSVGVSFLFRPLGAVLAGHLGDRLGRRTLLVGTLGLMGASTCLIGLLPTYASIGVTAPVLLVLLRVAQGVSAGGEWGGAALLAVEHAPAGARGRFGAMPQIGVPLGLLLSSAVMAVMTSLAPDGAFERWGWRVPFLLSAVLFGLGVWVRSRVAESPVFEQVAARAAHQRVPLVTLLRGHGPLVLLAALTFAGNSAAGYMTTGGFVQKYATDPAGIGLPRGPVLWVVAGTGVVWLVTTAVAGALSDVIGRRRTYVIGWACQAVMVFPLFWLVGRGTLVLLFVALALFTVGIGFTYGPQAAFFAEMFPAPIRYTGVAVSYAVGAVLGGAFAPLIAQALVDRTGGTAAVSAYLLAMTLLGWGATALLRDNDGIALGPDTGARARSPRKGATAPGVMQQGT